jgi:hypothetical protein
MDMESTANVHDAARRPIMKFIAISLAVLACACLVIGPIAGPIIFSVTLLAACKASSHHE